MREREIEGFEGDFFEDREREREVAVYVEREREN
jgi:hypothetical protein